VSSLATINLSRKTVLQGARHSRHAEAGARNHSQQAFSHFYIRVLCYFDI
jgi:hypothetical protein